MCDVKLTAAEVEALRFKTVRIGELVARFGEHASVAIGIEDSNGAVHIESRLAVHETDTHLVVLAAKQESFRNVKG